MPEAAEQNAVVMSAVASTAARFVDGGYGTFVDGVVGPWFLEPFLSVARASAIEIDYVVFRPSEQVAVQRAAARGPAGLSDASIVRKIYREFTDLGDLERVVVDSSTQSPQATAQEVLAGLAAGRFAIG